MIAFLSSNVVFVIIGTVIIVGLLFLLRFLFPKLRNAEIKRAEITISPSSGLGLKIETFAQENSILSLEITHALNVPISPDLQRLINLMIRYGNQLFKSNQFRLPFRGKYEMLRVLEKTSTYPVDIFALMNIAVSSYRSEEKKLQKESFYYL